MPTQLFNMQSYKRSNPVRFSLRKITFAVAASLLLSQAQAAGLGKLTVLSSLGQPLRAEIELNSVSSDEAGALVAKLASGETFRQANVEFNASLMSLRFAVEQQGGRHIIRVNSPQPLNEPFVDMLLELDGPNGRLIREYTFLLDPPDMRATQSAQVSPAPVSGLRGMAPAPRAAQPQRDVPPAARTSRPAPSAARNTGSAQTGSADESARAEQYRVKPGDTLAKIAGRLRSESVSLDQMLVALYRANPDAFAGKNMNRLRAGEILSVPSTESVGSIGKSEARGIVVAQSADFNHYRDRLAGRVAADAPRQASESGQVAGGKITTRVEEPASPAGTAQDKLKLSEANVRAGTGADAAGKGASAEDGIAHDKALADANARLKTLEKNVGELQKLLEVKNRELANQQANAAQTTGAKSEGEHAGQTKPITAPTPPTASPPAGTSAPVAGAPATPAAPAAVPPAATSQAPAPVKPKAKPVAPPPPPPEPSLLDSLRDNPLLLPGAGLLVLALAALGVVRARRRKQESRATRAPVEPRAKSDTLFASNNDQAAEPENSGFHTSFSAGQQESTEVDPIAEADVYIAYGRDAQAEEILKEALRVQPDRNALRLKLLEIYSNRKDRQAFGALATELHGLTKGEGEDWAQAAAMGIALDPENPLYASARKSRPSAGELGIIAAAAAPLAAQGFGAALSAKEAQAAAAQDGQHLAAGAPENLSGAEADDAALFSNTLPSLDTPLELPSTGTPAVAKESEPAAESSIDDLDFDLDGMVLEDMAVPNTIPRPPIIEPNADLASIDFDFLDQPASASEEPVVNLSSDAAVTEMFPDIPALSEVTEPAPAAVTTTVPEPDMATPLDLSDLTIPELDVTAEEPAAMPTAEPLELSADDPALMAFDLPEIPELPATNDAPTGKAEREPVANLSDPLDFDLSGISLELDEPASTPDFDSGFEEKNFGSSFGDTDFTPASSEEMATKLDLALAYQEIGDKEGARELLDEVLKGGTPEQSARAKTLLLDLA